MLTAGVACGARGRRRAAPTPAVVAGHSLGEYTALVAAGALRFADALPLVRFRAQAMQEAVPAGVGAMAAILGLDDAARRRRVRRGGAGAGGRAGEFQRAGADRDRRAPRSRRARDRAAPRRRGAKRGVLLPVSAPFHSSLLKPAARAARGGLARGRRRACRRFRSLHNVDVRERRDADGDPRRAGAAGGEPGALGRDDAGVRRARRHAHRRVRAGHGADAAWPGASMPDVAVHATNDGDRRSPRRLLPIDGGESGE